MNGTKDANVMKTLANTLNRFKPEDAGIPTFDSQNTNNVSLML